jgi:probable F420-dependent oxidoreductase
MQFGVNILNFGPGASPAAFLRWAQVSEALGYHSLMISDHVAITPSLVPRYPEPYYDCFASLSWLAGQTTRIRLGTTVTVVPYRHPVLNARLVANLDEMSGGRFIYGVGVGNPQDEFSVLGVAHEHRGAIANESLRIMLALWNSPEPVTMKGRFFDIEEVSGIRTAQQPHPPIWVGGLSDAAIRRAARYGEGWHPIFRTLDQIDAAERSHLPALAAIAAQRGRPIPQFCPRIRLDLRDEPLGDDRFPGSGSLEQVRGDLVRLEKLGVSHVTLDWYTGDLEATRNHERGLSMLAILAEQVIDLANEALR